MARWTTWSAGAASCTVKRSSLLAVKQVTPLHFHWGKDRGHHQPRGRHAGGQLYNATEDGKLADDEVIVYTDGIRRQVPAGGIVTLDVGESITLRPYCYHAFWAEGEPVLAGEVSLVNDDQRDNRFYEAPGRFPAIEEDEPPLYLMVTDYDALLPARTRRHHELPRSGSTSPPPRSRRC